MRNFIHSFVFKGRFYSLVMILKKEKKSIMMPVLDYMCLECGRKYKNTLDVAICPKCLKKEKEKHEKGVRSKYTTVYMYLRGNK